MAKVTVIIPNYNGLEYLKLCLGALKCQTYKDLEVCVVDNGSTDGSVKWLKTNSVPAIFLDKNYGFAYAVNRGIESADSPYVILLNNDTVAVPDYVEELVRAIEKSKKIFSVSPKMIQMDHPDLIDDAGDGYCLLGWGYQRGVGQSDKKYDKACMIFSACAGGGIFRRSVFEEIGLFDENFFAYLEDIDVGWRANIAGYYSRYCPDAKLAHVGSGTSGSRYNEFKVRLSARNNIYLLYKNMPPLQRAVNSPFILLGTVIKYFYFRGIGFGKNYLGGIHEGFSTRKKIKKIRYERRNLINYLAAEWELIVGTFAYAADFARRRLDGVKH